MKLGWNLFKFNTFAIDEGVEYKGKSQIQLQCLRFFAKELIGLRKIPIEGISLLNISPYLSERICHAIVSEFGKDFPQWIGVVIFRYDRFNKEAEEIFRKKGYTKRYGRVRYCFGILKDGHLDDVLDTLLRKKDYTLLQDYLKY